MARVVLFELNSQHPEQAAAFYSSVFGWKIGEPHWDYRTVTTGGDEKPGIDGGISLGPADYPHGIRVTIEVDSIDESLARAVEHGAKIVREKMEFDEFYLAYLVDPVGLGIGLIQNKK
ncbi:hypothetical protein NDK47_09470 [Brevibacillus ruminantium]|uniref:VOC domain-containing protein n=1 Tax=Brevibacillus ruminantium TaxID=2950604 RepID=A0ABY4WNR1_9BACL|nr:VOC family protein [Brevibacillus ruminantium]USG67480.1 hypothetical protein NDK47_09470 [Brevibacillus ruminantium]